MRRRLVESVSAALRSWFPQQSPRPRRRLAFQALESRLLLSADLMPVDGVLQIAGTEANDSVLIREVDGAALEIVLNDRALRFDLEGLEAVKVDLLGGHDTLEVEVGAAIDWDIALGAGDDHVEVNVSSTEPILTAPIVTGAGAGGGPHVKVFDGASAAEEQSFFAYSPSFTGGVRVATGDVNGDGTADLITGAGPGGPAHVKVFDGASGVELRSFFAYDGGFTGGVYVAAGDVNGDGRDDIITGADAGGGPHVKVFDGATLQELRSFFAYGSGFQGGVRVASGDVNGDGFADIVTGTGAGAPAHVKVFDGLTSAELRSFFAYDTGFTGGVFVAAGDVTGDGRDDIITGADAGGGPHVKVFDGGTLELASSFFAYTPSFTGGVRVAAGDVNGDGLADIITGAGPGAGSHVKVFDGRSNAELQSFFPYGSGFQGGVYVASGELTGPAGSFDLDLAIDAGEGNDLVAVELAHVVQQSDTAPAAVIDLAIDAGAGGDAVSVAARGAFDEFDLRVDLGADAAGDTIPTETLSLNFDQIKFQYSAQSEHSYRAGGGSDGVDARYEVTLRSDGEKMQSSHKIETMGGVVSDQVDVQVGGSSTQSVGSLATVSVGSRTDTVDHDEKITIHGNRTEDVGPEVSVAILGVDNLSMASAIGIAVGGDRPVEVRKTFEDNARSASVSSSTEVRTGAGDDSVEGYVVTGVTHAAPGHAAFDLSIDAGAGNDAVSFMFNPKEITISKRVPWQGTAGMHVDMGTGSDVVDVRVVHPHRSDMRTSVVIELGGADAGRPETGDEVLVVFENGDARQPVIIGTLWNSQDTPGDEQKSLRLDMASAGRKLAWSAELHGGSGEDHVQLSFEGKLKVARDAPSLRGLFDLGGGDDSLVVDLSGLKIAGRTNAAPIQIAALGGEGDDALDIVGTRRADVFLVGEAEITLKGAAVVSHQGFESFLVRGGLGNDKMIAVGAPTGTTLDGGAGRDVLIGGAGDVILIGGAGKDLIDGKREHDAPSRNFADWALPVQADPNARARGPRGR